MELTNRELGTVLAALRYWQRSCPHNGDELWNIATDEGSFSALDADEIDDLCSAINTSSTIPEDDDHISELLEAADFPVAVGDTVQDLINSTGRFLDACTEPTTLYFRTDKGACWYVGTVEFVISEASPKAVLERQQELADIAHEEMGGEGGSA